MNEQEFIFAVDAVVSYSKIVKDKKYVILDPDFVCENFATAILEIEVYMKEHYKEMCRVFGKNHRRVMKRRKKALIHKNCG